MFIDEGTDLILYITLFPFNAENLILELCHLSFEVFFELLVLPYYRCFFLVGNSESLEEIDFISVQFVLNRLQLRAVRLFQLFPLSFIRFDLSQQLFLMEVTDFLLFFR
jgi:hypothetical protein